MKELRLQYPNKRKEIWSILLSFDHTFRSQFEEQKNTNMEYTFLAKM
jgi:hypothetical protein